MIFLMRGLCPSFFFTIFVVLIVKTKKNMATLRKYVTTTDINVYEVELTEEQLEIYNSDIDRFYDEVQDELEWEWVHDNVGDEDWELELKS